MAKTVLPQGGLLGAAEKVKTEKNRVLIIVENLPVPIDRRVWLEATTLRKNGYHVSVICPTGKGYDAAYEELEGVHIYRHPLPPEISSASGHIREYLAALTWEFRLACRVWREQGFDIVHICNPPDLLFLVAGWFKLLRKTRIIFDHHDINPELYVAKYGKHGFFYHALRLAERSTFALADVVISTNESYREIALTRGRKADRDVVVVRSAPDLADFRERPPNPDHRQGRTFLVGYLGVMGEQDGLDYLFRTIYYIVSRRKRRDIQFMLMGDGPAFHDLQELAGTLGISDYVEFAGFRTGEDLLERLSTCDVCVSPDPRSPYNNLCTMNKILEYMALGKPIVQFDLLEGRRSAGDASLYATPNDEQEFGDKLLQLLEDPDARQQMGEIGKARMREMLQWKHQVPKLLYAFKLAIKAAPIDQS